MPNSKQKATKTPTNSNNGKTPKPETITNHVPPADLFPFAQYASVVGVHIILVGFTALYLPQTTRLFVPLPTRTTDRPQSDFMEALTADPVLTLSWICGGLRRGAQEDEIKVDRVRFNNLRFKRLTEATAFTMCAAVATWLVIVMFGAPLASHHSHTALLASVVAILTSFVPAFTLGYPSLASDTPAMINRNDMDASLR
ncbi:hypothetical protein BU15DRAFT_79754 [Melanogaster broomeanus]|nr:hypothetical protein BU15DRAFT_79754 [Melanogaster broomeanus]